MTYQPYPTGGGNSNTVQQGQGQGPAVRPSSVRIAVILMYIGSGLSTISLILVLSLSGRIKNAVGTSLRKAKTTKPLTATQIHNLETAYLVVAVIVLVIAVGLWLWMAWANGRGKGWARIVSSVIFGIDTLLLILGATRASSALAFTGLIWLVGLVVVILLWRRDTTQYIAQSQ